MSETDTTAESPIEFYVDPVDNTAPGLILGLNAVVGSMWWIITMFFYVKNEDSDADLITIDGTQTIPIGWWWERMGDVIGDYRYLSLSLFLNWIFYFVVSVMEMIAWAFYLVGDMQLAALWFGTVGYWGTLIAYVIPPLFAIIHIADKLKGETGAWPGSYCLFLIIPEIIMWIAGGVLHVFFAPAFIQHIIAQKPPTCQCDLTEVADLTEDADEEEKAVWEAAKAERARACEQQCPPEEGDDDDEDEDDDGDDGADASEPDETDKNDGW